MTDMKPIYLKCNRCDAVYQIDTETDVLNLTCQTRMPFRISQICGGSISNPATEEEFERAVDEFILKEAKKAMNDGTPRVRIDSIHDFLTGLDEE